MTLKRGNRQLILAAGATAAAACFSALAAPAGIAHPASGATGFAQPYAGAPKYQKYGPTEATTARQINRRLGAKRTAWLARKLGLDRRHSFTEKQYKLFVSGKGVGGDPAAAKLVDESVRILTNTTGNPL